MCALRADIAFRLIEEGADFAEFLAFENQFADFAFRRRKLWQEGCHVFALDFLVEEVGFEVADDILLRLLAHQVEEACRFAFLAWACRQFQIGTYFAASQVEDAREL